MKVIKLAKGSLVLGIDGAAFCYAVWIGYHVAQALSGRIVVKSLVKGQTTDDSPRDGE